MVAQSSECCGRCVTAIRRCHNLLSAFNAGRITLEEYGYNLATTLVGSCNECMQACVDGLPTTVAIVLFVYLERFLKPVDFMPGPELFIPGAASEEEIEQTKRALRPKYIQLYQLMRDRASATASRAGN